MYASLGTGLVEFLAMAFKPSWQPALQIEAQQGAPVVAEGQGIVLATAHTGNWDLVACAAASRMPLTVVTKRLSIGLLDRLWQRTRARRGVRLVSEGKAAQALSTALRRGEAVAMLIDQAPERSRAAIRVDFLGAPALVDLAPALVALRARVPLVAVFPVRRADGAHAATIAGVLVPPCRPSRDWAEHAMHTVTRWLEDHVRRHPEQWLWMHRRWKGAEGATKTRPEVVSERVVA
jgi:KDO2-lipid IV(A) lauroyltransferase